MIFPDMPSFDFPPVVAPPVVALNTDLPLIRDASETLDIELVYAPLPVTVRGEGEFILNEGVPGDF